MVKKYVKNIGGTYEIVDIVEFPVETADISNDAVTYANLQNVSATSRILGRKTAGAGDVEECTLSEVLDFIGSAAQGDILYRGAAGWARLGAGTSGYLLQTQGAGANPQWSLFATGSWTPDLQFGGAKVGITYSTQQGLYFRIGRFVHCQGFINLTSKGSSAGAATIEGLPFTTTATTYSMAPIAYATFNTTPAYMQVPPSGTSLTVLKPSGAGGATSAQNTDFTNTSSMLFSVQFMTD